MISDIIKGVIAVIVIGATLYCAKFAPDLLDVFVPMAGVVFGYFFRSKEESVVALGRGILGRGRK